MSTEKMEGERFRSKEVMTKKHNLEKSLTAVEEKMKLM